MNISYHQFGLIIAYLLPGFLGLAALTPLNPLVATWLLAGDGLQAGVGPPVYAVLAATTIGMIASCFRWILIDHVHHWMGVRPPAWDDRRLSQHLAAFNYLVESHYRYYQFVANALIVIGLGYAAHRLIGTTTWLSPKSDIAVLVLCIALFTASRDALSKYYARTALLIGTADVGSVDQGTTPNRSRGSIMFNGNHPDGDTKPSNPSTQTAKPQIDPTPPAKPDNTKRLLPKK